MLPGVYGRLPLDLGLRDHDEQEKVAGQELARGVHDLGSHGGLGEIGNPDHQSALLLEREQSGGCADVIGLGNFSSDNGELLDQMAKLGSAATRHDSLVQRPAVSQQADAVPGVERELGKTERGIDCPVEFAVTSAARAHEASTVEDEPDCLAALDAEMFLPPPLPRRAVAVQQTLRSSSPSRYSRRLSKSEPEPRSRMRRICNSIWRLRAR